jgi:hypothetical protein
MTRLTTTEKPGEEFVVRGRNTLKDADDDAIVFYADVTKAHVVPERQTFTIQVITADLVLEMDFADADSVREALAMFEERKVLEVDFDGPDAVRIFPSSSKPSGA